jgi:hypothetical protein
MNINLPIIIPKSFQNAEVGKIHKNESQRGVKNYI